MFQWLRRFFNAGTTTLREPADWLVSWFRGGTTSDSGIPINERSTLGYAPVYYAVSMISGSLAMMPLTLHKRITGGAEKAKKHPAYRLMRKRPNRGANASHFKETLMVHALIHGNGKAAVIREGRRPVEVLTIEASRSVTIYSKGEKWHGVRIDDDDDQPLADTQPPSAQPGKDDYDRHWLFIHDEDVIHIPGLGLDGSVGLQTYRITENSTGLGLAAEKAANIDFKNGSKPGVILQAPKGMFREAKDARELVNEWNDFHGGLENKNKTALLKDGVTATLLATNNDEAQWVEQRTFQRQEVGLIFKIHSLLNESMSFASAEQMNLNYLIHTLTPWLVKIEEECDEKLLSDTQKRLDSHFFKFNTGVLLRADFKSTAETLSLLITSRIITRNEAREKLDMNAVEGGDEFENPAIDTTKDNETETETTQITPEDANKRAIVAHFGHLIRTECKAVLNSAGNRRDYIKWMDGWYDGKMQETFARACETFDAPRSIAEDHCRRSKNELLDVAGCVGPEGLADAVAEVTEYWPERAEEIANQILGELTHV